MTNGCSARVICQRLLRSGAEILHKVSRVIIPIMLLASALMVPVNAEMPKEIQRSHEHDFGSVAIDFRISHTFEFKNPLNRSIKLEEINIECDCSTVKPSDSIIEPGGTLQLDVTLNTRNLFGRANKGFTVHFDDTALSEISYLMSVVVGQWPGGIRPKPLSLFFIPGNKSKTIAIHNPVRKHISLNGDDAITQFDSSFVAEILVDEARRGENLSIKIIKAQELAKGTYVSNLTLHIDVDGQSGPTVLTIPIKIVAY